MKSSCRSSFKWLYTPLPRVSTRFLDDTGCVYAIYDRVFNVAFGKIGFDAYFLTEPLYSGFNWKTTQPVSSKNLVDTRGNGVYSHLKELRQLDFISHQNVGRLKIYTTTEKFQKYFGIQGDQDTIKAKLFKQVRKTSKGTSEPPKQETPA